MPCPRLSQRAEAARPGREPGTALLGMEPGFHCFGVSAGSRIALGWASLVRDLRSSNLRLLELDLRASLFELGLDLLRLFLVYAFLYGRRRGFDQVLCFLPS